jgi:hypothetical protein
MILIRGKSEVMDQTIWKKLSDKCKEHNLEEPIIGEKYEAALEKVLKLIEYLENEINEINQYYWS